ncbi:unnamed protein product [Prorocentrum cordatum]|uniref:Uncharacterized protein n=1 Tax=Prorocentrum cordatum TaxID=2364126 RepID=A0ABN9V699_9DINO|nr:unnamed protein product [Polarella glacialis]
MERGGKQQARSDPPPLMILCRVPTRSVKGKSPPLANQATAHGRPWAPRNLAARRQTVRASTGGEEEEEEEEEREEGGRREGTAPSPPAGLASLQQGRQARGISAGRPAATHSADARDGKGREK